MELLTKLNYKRQSEVLILNAPKTFKNDIEEFKKNIEVNEDENIYIEIGFVLVFIKNIEDIEKYSELVLPRVSKNALIWFAFPKQALIDDGWEIVRDYQFEPMRQIAINNEWLAMRLRPNKNARGEGGNSGSEEKIKIKKKIEF